MKLSLDCLPCLLRQTLDAARQITDDLSVQKRLIAEALKILSDYERYETSPEIARDIHRMIKVKTGDTDPYHDMKAKHIEAALKILPTVRSLVHGESDQLLAAIKAAAVGNMIDAAIFSDIDVETVIIEQMKTPFARCDIDVFKQYLEAARTILIIGDNAGESVFDRLLIEQLSQYKIYYAVKSQPIINDATRFDANASGLQNHTEIIESGCDSPGTLLQDATDSFLTLFQTADIVISKGQGNFEGLSDTDRPVFYLLKAKCDMIANRFDVSVGDNLFVYQSA